MIKTNLKFKKADNGQFYGFVTRVGASMKGCNENDQCKKSIVFADKKLTGIIPNALYRTTLIPMNDEKHGFIAINADIIKFKARVEALVTENEFKVEVKFGNKVITYDPSSKSKMYSSISRIAEILSHRVDIMYPGETVNDFLEAANIVLAYYKDYKDIEL